MNVNMNMDNKKKDIDYEDTCERALIMMNLLPIACIMWGKDYNIIDCNEIAYKFFGFNSKHEFIENLEEIYPLEKKGVCLSKNEVIEHIKITLKDGRYDLEIPQMKNRHQLVGTEMIYIRTKYKGSDIVVSYCLEKEVLEESFIEKQKASQRTQILYDTAPLCCNFWNSKFENIDCNQEAVNLFELKDKKEYLERFFELSPEYQPDGRLSSEKALEKITLAFSSGRAEFEWMHQKLNGEPVPSEITLVRVKYGDEYVVAGYTRDLRELKNTVNTLNIVENMAYTDSLTNVYNRRYFMEILEKEFIAFPINKKPISIIMFDLDKFKNINDTFGHLAGDEILKNMCVEVQSVLRENDVLVRYGGEEFVILAVNSKKNEAVKLAERVRRRIEEFNFEYMDQKIAVTISLGVATKTDNDYTIDQLIGESDEALYLAKANGRNRVEKL